MEKDHGLDPEDAVLKQDHDLDPEEAVLLIVQAHHFKLFSASQALYTILILVYPILLGFERALCDGTGLELL